MPVSPLPARALALILPLALCPLIPCGGARAGEGGWTDPPARATAAAPAARSPAPGVGAPAAPKAAVPASDDEGLPKAADLPAAASPAAGPNRAAALAPPSPGARMRRPGRLADTPASGAPAAGTPVDDRPRGRFATAEPPSGDRAAAARDLARDYLAAVSGPGEAMVGAALRFYGARVRFYGRPTTLAALIAEKRSFVRRWPERRYAPRTIRTACDGAGCTVRAIVDFRAASPGRGAVARGAAELVLEVRFSGSRPVIVAETGRVLRRGAQAGAQIPSPAPSLAPSADGA